MAGNTPVTATAYYGHAYDGHPYYGPAGTAADLPRGATFHGGPTFHGGGGFRGGGHR